MAYILKLFGVIFIAIGLIYIATQVSPLKKQNENMEYWKKAADENSDNELIEQKYLSLNSDYKSSLSLTITIAIYSVVPGILFFALSSIITALRTIMNNSLLNISQAKTINDENSNVEASL
ncbi:hypothetical protein LRR81_01385 [Metabacillus sp. GX 13764]|uniref:hypothetical protein n=1 Tax=Metabacillus kandeliae TaxID=2900151 RepID=UPI001E52335A|nr:hypothetical protein [Metabacillus kandeliae]MCD7032863.1 hypothetical protein [Metabacillus kandeliae]